MKYGRVRLLQKQKDLNVIESDAQETSDQQSSRSAYAYMCICTIWSRPLGLYRIKRLTRNMGPRPRIHMTNKVPDWHLNVHPHSLSSIFAIEKKNKKKQKKNVRPFCLATAHSSTKPACDVCFLKQTHSICPNNTILGPRTNTEQDTSLPCKGGQTLPFGWQKACKTPVLGEITNPWLNTSPF